LSRLDENRKEDLTKTNEDFIEELKPTSVKRKITAINYEDRWIMEEGEDFVMDYGISVEELYDGLYLMEKNMLKNYMNGIN
jgi:hypothetical protein